MAFSSMRMQFKDSKPIPWQLQALPLGAACIILSFLYNISSVENGLLTIATLTSVQNPIGGAREYNWIQSHAEFPYEIVFFSALVFIALFAWWKIRPPHFHRTGTLALLLTVLFVVSYVIFSAIANMTIAYASSGQISPTQTATYSQFQVSNCNYLIFNDTQNVYAMPCSTGWGGAGSYGGPNALGGDSGSSFSAIFSSVLSNLPNGGSIEFASGLYVAQTGIEITQSALNIYGSNYEGNGFYNGTVIKAGSPSVSYLWTYNDTTHSILSDQLTYVQFEGIKGISYVGLSVGTWQGDNNKFGPSQITLNNVESENFAFDMVVYATWAYQNNFNQVTLMAPRNAGLVLDGSNQMNFNGVEISNFQGSDPLLGNSGNSTDVCLGDCLQVGYNGVNQAVTWTGGHIAYNEIGFKFMKPQHYFPYGEEINFPFTGTEFESLQYIWDVEANVSRTALFSLVNCIFFASNATKDYITSLTGGLSAFINKLIVRISDSWFYGLYQSGYSYNTLFANQEAWLFIDRTSIFDRNTPRGPVTTDTGVQSFSPSGSQTAFTITTDVLATPVNAIIVTCGSSACLNNSFYTSNSAYSYGGEQAEQITVTFFKAPSAGTNSLYLEWFASYNQTSYGF